MGLSPTAAAAAIARPRSSSSRFVSTTCAAGKHRAEARGESRLTTEDRRRAREGLRFDGAPLRTSRSLTWMKSEVPTPLKTDLDVETDSAVGPRAPSTPRRSARYAIQQGWSADPSFEFCTARRRSWLCRTLVRQLAATTAGFYKRSAISGSSRTIPANLSPDSHPLIVGACMLCRVCSRVRESKS